MLHGIQACRTIAAIMVVLFHAAGNLAKEKYFGKSAEILEQAFHFGGQAGVAFFFVLSGFIIHHVHSQDFNRPNKLSTYIKKRLIRILPTYLILFLSVYFLALATPQLRDTMPNSTEVLLKSLLLLPQDKSIVGGTGAPVLIVAWSLQYEMVFYAIFALALIRRELFWLAATATFINIILEPALGPYDFPNSFIANPLVLLFGMGIISSIAVKSKLPALYARHVSVTAVLGFASVAVFATYHRSEVESTVVNLAYGFFSSILIVGISQHETDRGSSSTTRRIATLGDSSYSLYLLHFPLIAILSKIAIFTLPRTTSGATFAFIIMASICTAAALAFNRIIERPTINALGKAFLK